MVHCGALALGPVWRLPCCFIPLPPQALPTGSSGHWPAVPLWAREEGSVVLALWEWEIELGGNPTILTSVVTELLACFW